MNRPRLLAMSALIAAAWCTTAHAQQVPTPSNNDRSVQMPSDKGAVSPSRTDRDTSAQAQRNDPDRGKNRDDRAGSGAPKMDRSERKFVEEMIQHSMAEVETGRLAETRGASDEVKKFGQRMVQDHTKANEELKQIAQSKGIKMPAGPERSHKNDAERLGKLSGADFDKRYMSQMVKDHENDVKKVQKMAKDAKDPDVKAFAAKAAPIMEEHLSMARDISGSKKGK